MATTLQEVCGYENLTGLFTNVKGGVPDILPPEFQRVGQRVSGDTAKYMRVSNARTTAPTNTYGSPSKSMQKESIADVPVTLLHEFNHVDYSAATLVQLRAEDSPAQQQRGKQEIARQTGEFSRKHRNTRIAAIQSALFTGYIYFDGNGNLLPDSTGDVVSVDFSVPANNKDQCNSIIDASWATAGTDILSHVNQLHDIAIQTTGYPLEYAFYGRKVLEDMAANTSLANLINGNPGFAQSFLQSRIPDGFLGLKWRPAGGAFYVDSDGTAQTWLSTDTLVLTPAPDLDWFEIIEGSYLVPTRTDITTDAIGAANSLAEVNGMFSYATVSMDPPGIRQYMGDTFLPALKVPGAIYIVDTNF